MAPRRRSENQSKATNVNHVSENDKISRLRTFPRIERCSAWRGIDISQNYYGILGKFHNQN